MEEYKSVVQLLEQAKSALMAIDDYSEDVYQALESTLEEIEYLED